MEMKECNIKATAILVGYVSEAALAGKRYAPEKDFADLLARITSSNPKIRGEAKDRIVKLARRGGYYLDDTRPHEQEKHPIDPEFPNQGKAWSKHDAERLRSLWNDGNTLNLLTSQFGRSAGALCARLVHDRVAESREAVRAENIRRNKAASRRSNMELL